MKKIYTTTNGGIAIREENETVPKDFIELDSNLIETYKKWCKFKNKTENDGSVGQEYYNLFLSKVGKK